VLNARASLDIGAILDDIVMVVCVVVYRVGEKESLVEKATSSGYKCLVC